MKESRRVSAEKLLKMLIYGVMGIQIGLGILWMIFNFTAVPVFGDSSEYLGLSESMVLDEYRPALYPFLLRCIRWAESFTRIPYQAILYTIQILASFSSILYGVMKLDETIFGEKSFSQDRKMFHIFFSFYLLTIPMINFMNLTVLTDSLANSALILFLSGMIVFLNRKQIKPACCALIVISLIIQSLLRADRLYSCILMLAVCLAIRMIRIRENRKKTVLTVFAMCILSVGIVKGVSHVTQTPGINGRVQTNLSFVLLDRVVWPNMAENYQYFPQEIRDIVSIEDARKFDEHNNNVMYQMAPLMEEKAGQESARNMYRQMAAIVLERQAAKVFRDIGEDILAMAGSPVSSLLHAYGRCDKNDSWNIHCMSTKTPSLTKNYNFYYQYSFLVSILFGSAVSVLYWIKKRNRNIRKAMSAFLPYLVFSLILTLWFSIGDGAPPNDRYAMIIYIAWALVLAALWGMWEKAPGQDAFSIRNRQDL